MAFYNFLPGVQPALIDTPLVIDSQDPSPRVLIIGTAEKGPSLQPIPVTTTSSARGTFGVAGTLLRGIHEAKAQGARNIVALRVGGTSASLTGIGGVGGWTVVTDSFDDGAGAQYLIWYEASTGRLAVFDSTLGDWVHDSVGVLAPFSTGVTVTLASVGFTAGGIDIGTVSAPVAMEDVPGGSATYVAGTDGISCIKTVMYENLYNAFELLDFADFDIVVPMCVFIDDLNVADLAAGEIVTRALGGLSDYPTEDSAQDVLGKVFVQEVAGVNYFWWDMDGDGVAEIVPHVGSAGPSADADGVTLTASDFHEVNFAYQLANFCHNATDKWQFVVGVISFLAPTGFSLAALASWVGKLPTYTTNPITQVRYIAGPSANGNGMLGNKFLAGQDDWRAGVTGGGFIATDDGFLDGAELTDAEDNVVDIGKYISVCGAIAIHTNNYQSSGYISGIEASYGGFIASLAPQSAPTNKAVKNLRLIRDLKARKLDDMAGVRIVSLTNKPKGVVVTDAPTAARPTSNYTRLSTVRIVKSIVNTVRDEADPFLGEPNSPAQQQALKTILETALQSRVSDGSLRRFDLKVSSTPQQRVLGQLVIDLLLVPSFEVRFIPLTITLAAE